MNGDFRPPLCTYRLNLARRMSEMTLPSRHMSTIPLGHGGSLQYLIFTTAYHCLRNEQGRTSNKCFWNLNARAGNEPAISQLSSQQAALEQLGLYALHYSWPHSYGRWPCCACVTVPLHCAPTYLTCLGVGVWMIHLHIYNSRWIHLYWLNIKHFFPFKFWAGALG